MIQAMVAGECRFGYVMDVYMPRDKHNRHEHRGFGFVTFETEAAVHRVAAHGLHQIRVRFLPGPLGWFPLHGARCLAAMVAGLSGGRWTVCGRR
jgi:RNA recognition motif. (a.k.a. RRM, RBD, or RNP domain)